MINGGSWDYVITATFSWAFSKESIFLSRRIGIARREVFKRAWEGASSLHMGAIVLDRTLGDKL